MIVCGRKDAQNYVGLRAMYVVCSDHLWHEGSKDASSSARRAIII